MEIGKITDPFKESDRPKVQLLQSAARGSKHEESEGRLTHPSLDDAITNSRDNQTHLVRVRETLTEKQLYKHGLDRTERAAAAAADAEERGRRRLRGEKERQLDLRSLQRRNKFQEKQFHGGKLQGEVFKEDRERRGTWKVPGKESTREAQLREQRYLHTSFPDRELQGVQRWVHKTQPRSLRNTTLNQELWPSPRKAWKPESRRCSKHSWREVWEPVQKVLTKSPVTCFPDQVEQGWRVLERNSEVKPELHEESSGPADISSEQEEMQIDPAEPDSLLPDCLMDCTLCLAGSLESLAEV